MASMHVSLSEQMRLWVESQVSAGRYHNASEYFRDLIRRDQDAQERLQDVRRHLSEGAEDIAAGRSEVLRSKSDIETFFDNLPPGDS